MQTVVSPQTGVGPRSRGAPESAGSTRAVRRTAHRNRRSSTRRSAEPEGGSTMHRLDLTSEEAYVLRDALQSYLSDLRMEMADTDRRDFRDQLKHRKEILEKVTEALAPAT